MRIACTVALVLISACGTSVAPSDASTPDTGVSRVGLECVGTPCGPREICPRNDGIICRATPPGCNPQFQPCTGAECLERVPCEPCVAEAMRCDAGMECVIDRDRASMRFVDAICRPMR
jgi:hypothetical protein